MSNKKPEILLASMEVFKKCGIKKTSMDKVCQELRISKKTLYKYVSNKKELLTLAIIADLKKYLNEIKTIIDAEPQAIDQLIRISIFINKEMCQWTPEIFLEIRQTYPDIRKNLANRKRECLFRLVKDNLLTGIKQGLYRQELNADLVARLYVKEMEDLHDTEWFMKGNITFKEVFTTMIDNHIRGIANEEGIAYYEQKSKNLKLN
jgi:AcrR family transcriptional regulator